ncbi:tumor suppressor candidate 2 [Onychostruthus taczanowskii]|uniref:tumor suppressor candidate 2 n=1 Tax=Onychostruthus taczanowskii TaxID=356909 RepID=UPI001B7FF350|nr:tumor suppressor candidate 2 [Onychostruthus taczanowskii]
MGARASVTREWVSPGSVCPGGNELSLRRSRALSTNKGILVTRPGLRCVLGGAGWVGRDGKRSPRGVGEPWVPTRGAGRRRRDSNPRFPRCRRRAGRRARPAPVSRDAGAGSGAGGGAGGARSVSPGGSARAATPFVFTRRGSMYYDEDGDLAHEFYEETIVTKNGRKRAKLKRIHKNLIPQGIVKLEHPRIHVDFPVIICEV